MSVELTELIKTRRSVRKYKPDPVDEAIVRDVIDCGRLAASGNNIQPWEFVVVRDQATRDRLAEAAKWGKFIKDAPVCIVVFCKETEHDLEDGSAAIQNILVAAWAHGVGSCWVAGHKKPHSAAVAEICGAPKDLQLVALVAMGYASESPQLPKKRSLDEVLHLDQF